MRILMAFMAFWPIFITAQQRYVDPVFAGVERQTLVYMISPDGDTLRLDMFEPAGDTMANRSLLLYVHGGGFAGGERDHPRHVKFCEEMARRGYVTATMSYTLRMKGKSFGCDRPAPEKIQTFLGTAQDVNSATRFLVERSAELGIDPSKVVLLGSSAGAEAIMHAAFWKASYRKGDDRILPETFRYGGVVSMAGAITDLTWVNPSTAIPAQMFHGTCDNLVPYGHAPHHYCPADQPGFLMLYGAFSVAEHLRRSGLGYYLVTGCYGRHEWNITPIYEHVDHIIDFIYHDVVLSEQRQIHVILPSASNGVCEEYNSFRFCPDP